MSAHCLLVGSGKFDGVEGNSVGRWGDASGNTCPRSARWDVWSGDELGGEKEGVNKEIGLLFTAIDAREAHGRVPVLLIRSLLLETHETLHVTIAVTQRLRSGELGRSESGTPSPGVHLNSLPNYFTLTRMLERQWR